MNDRASLQKSINDLNGQIESLKARKLVLEEQLERLRIAKRDIYAVYEDDLAYVRWLDSYDVGTTWHGQRREEFEVQKSSAKESAAAYCDKVYEVYQSVVTKIGDVEGERGDIDWEIFTKGLTIGSLQWSLAITPY